jgi:leader peptidase (prepilin peptidase) / N-methyltransferase
MQLIDPMIRFYQAFPISSLLILGLIGMFLGSFINVVVNRYPIMLKRDWYKHAANLPKEVPFKDTYPKVYNLAVPHSHCDSCKKRLFFYHNIPLISYLFLQGRCAFCQSPISWRYPVMELLTGCLFLVIFFVFGLTWAACMLSVLTLFLIVLTMIDMDEMLLPDDMTLLLVWLGLLFNLLGGLVPLQDAVIGAMAGYLSLWSVYWCFKLLTQKEGMGYGDFKLLAALGAWLGWQQLPVIILLASFIGTLIGGCMLLIQNKSRTQPIPFGPYLAIAGFMDIFLGQDMINWYFANWM